MDRSDKTEFALPNRRPDAELRNSTSVNLVAGSVLILRISSRRNGRPSCIGVKHDRFGVRRVGNFRSIAIGRIWPGRLTVLASALLGSKTTSG